MSYGKFKISSFGVGDWQTVKLLFDQPRESEQYPGTYSVGIEHKGEQKYWNFAKYIVDRLRELGASKGTVLKVARQEGEGGKTFCQVELDGDITTQPQNNPAPQSTHTVVREPVKEKDWDKINWAKCKTLFAVAAYEQGKALTAETKLGCEKWADYCMQAERTGEADTPPENPDKISVEDLPFS